MHVIANHKPLSSIIEWLLSLQWVSKIGSSFFELPFAWHKSPLNHDSYGEPKPFGVEPLTCLKKFYPWYYGGFQLLMPETYHLYSNIQDSWALHVSQVTFFLKFVASKTEPRTWPMNIIIFDSKSYDFLKFIENGGLARMLAISDFPETVWTKGQNRVWTMFTLGIIVALLKILIQQLTNLRNPKTLEESLALSIFTVIKGHPHHILFRSKFMIIRIIKWS